MKKIILYSASIYILIAQVFCAVYAQRNTAISDSIYSNILKEQRSLKILLPDNYKPGSTDKYEVIFITDGEWGMDPFSFVYGWAKSEDYVPPVIIVAIPNRYINGKNQRDRDFLSMHVPYIPISGGASNFLSFIKNELIPYIDNKYPSNKTHSIYGHSFGGLFALYTLLSEPQLFESYYATDPPFGFDNDYMIKITAEKLNTLPSDKILWIAGRSENHDIVRLDSLLQASAPKNLHWKMVAYENEKHNSVRLKAMYDGVKYVYSGYSKQPLIFFPTSGILLKDKPISIWIDDSYPDLRYTLDGTEPDRTSPKFYPGFKITGPVKLVVKSSSANGKFNRTTRGNFELGETPPSIQKPAKINSGGLKYSYYEGNWENLPDFKNLQPVKTGVADNTFSINGFPRAAGFACLFEGYFEIVKDGYYDFALVANNRSKLFIGDKLILDSEGVRPNESARSFVLPLEKGFYPVRIEYLQKNENSSFQLYCVKPDDRGGSLFPLQYEYYEK